MRSDNGKEKFILSTVIVTSPIFQKGGGAKFEKLEWSDFY